ncbi:kinesin-like protein KIN-14O isoform X3 [Nylanderia fulva]|uniref:kinesin-like protein KIN-14O isoform X3 n=1 Tax=Nylanderia fulva TaxID=613905 RepID=UPI0010FB5253|nr:kinesin-like protein KIN-14O isoform X3 [Nylanderia fulva]
MGWLSLCVCGTKNNFDEKKNKRDGKDKKSKNKKSKKQSKQNKSHKTSLSFVDETLRKLQDEQVENEIIKKDWTNGKINCFDDCAKNQIDVNNPTDLTKIDDAPNNRWSYQIDDDHNNFEELRKESSERNVTEFDQPTYDFDYDDAVLHSRCASNTVDEDDKQVKCISDEEEHHEEADLNEFVLRSVTPGELKGSFWISEFKEKQDVLVEPGFDRKFEDRTSSKINFSSKEKMKSKTRKELRKESRKESRNILPPIKRESCAESCMDNEELQRNCEEMNKFGFKSSEQSNIQRKLNSCSFEVRSFEDEERSEKTRIRNNGSMIPRLTSPMQQKNLIKSESDKKKNLQNGRVHSAVVSGVNLDQRTVTVEWFERGETKGKEVEIDAILALNRDLNQKMGPPPPVMNNHMLASSKARHSTRPSIPVKATSNKQVSRQTGRPTNIMSTPSVNGHGDSVSGLTGRRELENIPPTPTSTAAQYNLATSVQNKQQKQTQQQQQQLQQQQQQQTQVENGRGRRSNVVKEVERLKKNREERRQRQAEIKEAMMNVDPGNPYWEFLAMIREYQNGIEYRPLRDTDTVEDHQITVCVRKRPLNKKEHTRKEIDVITVPSKDQMVVHEPKSKVDLTKYLENQIFRFDYAFDETCNNEIVYKYTAKPLVQTIFEGGMATCFAYGQTGSGKTHTMGGDFNGKTQDCKKGIYAMVAKDVFKMLKLAKYRPLNLVISASFFEIYSGKVFDLLADKEKLRVLEDGKQQVQIVGLTEKVVENCDEVLKLIQHGNSARTSGQTSANSNSSRSHAVFQIIARIPGTHKVHGKFSLIDLAGNERGADTSSANRQTRMEGAEINKSLLALKECIRALSRKGTHLPFRASKLTQVLRDSFIGEKSKTCMIAMISPGMSSCEHSLNTLRYADRVKELAANDPTEVKASPTDDDRGMKIEEQGNNSVLSDSDLAQLRSLNEGELSQDLYTFHEAVSALQMLEEEVLDTHKLVMDNTTKFLNDAHSVFSATHEVDYDQEDSRSKTKANSINALNHRGGSSSINTITINDTDSTSDSTDTQTVLKTIRDIAAESPLKSPWKDEMDFSSNEEDSNIFLHTPDKPIPTKKSVTTGRISRKNSINKNLMERLIQRPNQVQRMKFSTVGKSQKYHWSGTFRGRRNILSKDKYRDTLYSPRDNEPNELNNQLANYNYYNEDFEIKKPTSKRDIFYPNEFNSQTNDDSWKNKWIDDSIDYQPFIDICTDEFTKFDRFKNYDIEQNNDALPTAFSDVNINLKRHLRKMTDVDNKDKKMCNIDLCIHERDNATNLYFQFPHINNINKEEYSNPGNARKSIDSSINKIELNTRKMNNNMKKSAVQSCCYKAWCLLFLF